MKTSIVMENLKYEDPIGTEIFPQGKLFRISYDAKTNKFRLRCFNRKDLDNVIETYSDVNPACFYMRQYGYDVPNKISIINSFGFFPCGFFFEIIKYIKLRYGSLNVLVLSDNLKKYINEKLIPIKTILKEKEIDDFEISNISEDSGRNSELISQGKQPFEYRDYQKISIEKLLFKGHGRGIVDLPTASGKSFFIGNFIYNIQKNISSDYTFLLLVPNKQLVSQMYNDFLDYGFKECELTKFTAGLKKNERFDSTKKIIIANRQYVFTNKELLPNIDVLICDECIRKDTKIQTIDGYKKIQDVHVGDIVKSFNIKDKTIEYKKVTEVHKNLFNSNSYDKFILLHMENGKKIYVTPNHKIYTSNRGYVRADELTLSDDLVID